MINANTQRPKERYKKDEKVYIFERRFKIDYGTLSTFKIQYVNDFREVYVAHW
jgi:hypothetical protein